MVLSHEPDTIRDLSGENATELTWLECPAKIFRIAGQFKGFPLFTGTICEAIFVISHLIDSYLTSEFPVWQSKANQNKTRGVVILAATKGNRAPPLARPITVTFDRKIERST